MILLYDPWAWSSLKPIVVIFGISLVITLLVFALSYALNGGRGILYKAMKDYGRGDFRTIGILGGIATKIARNEGYMCGEVFMSHEYGNRYSGYFYDGYGHEHQMDITTDGWNVSYSIDGGPHRRFKK